jgi:hypothetical protein
MTDPPDPAPPSIGRVAQRQLCGPGKLDVEHRDGTVQVDAVQVGPIGVVVDRIAVKPVNVAPIGARSRRLAQSLRPGGDRLVEVEVDEELGGATLRSHPEDMQGGRFFQVEIDADGAQVTRHKVGADGGRAREPFPLTRDELARTIDQMAEEPPECRPPPHPLDELVD